MIPNNQSAVFNGAATVCQGCRLHTSYLSVQYPEVSRHIAIAYSSYKTTLSLRSFLSCLGDSLYPSPSYNVIVSPLLTDWYPLSTLPSHRQVTLANKSPLHRPNEDEDRSAY